MAATWIARMARSCKTWETNMAEFTLPQMSKVQKGKQFAAKPGAKKVRTFRIYRWDPDVGGNPRVDSYEVDVSGCAMVLDVLDAVGLTALVRPAT